MVVAAAMAASGLISLSAMAAPDDVQPRFQPMTKQDYEHLLPDQTLIGEYRFLRERSKTYNFTEKHNADGTTDYHEGPIHANGVWYTLGRHKICYKYPNSPEMGQGISCFWVYNQEGCYYGYGFNNMTLHGPRKLEDWSARWILKGSGKSCDEAIG